MGRASTEDRFYAKVQHATTEVRPGLGACWLWTAAKNSDGYGSFFRNGRVALAHRASYEMHIGELPAEMYVLHRCDTPACVRPDHLFLGEQKDNVADMYEKGRESHQGPYADQCKYGHPWPEGSVAGTRRRCAICDREYTAKYEAARSERRRQSRRAPLPETVL